MIINRAKHLGMCFGVRDAIALALQQARHRPLTIYGELVHNETVVSSLRLRGIRIEHQPEQVPTADVMITAHGASQQAISKLEQRGLHVFEATCPLVHHAHRALQRLVAAGYYPVVIGQRGHVEVRGLTEDLPQFDIVLSEEDVLALAERPRFGIVAQTTQPIAKVLHLVTLIQSRFPYADIKFEDTVCQPTKQRQSAAVELAKNSDVVIVIGGEHSNNTRELAKTCRLFCSRVHQVQTSSDLRPEWFEGVERVGITAGTSTPDVVIDGVEHWIRAWADAQVAQPDTPRHERAARGSVMAA